MLFLIGLVGPTVSHVMAGDAMLIRGVGPVTHVGHPVLVLRHYQACQGDVGPSNRQSSNRSIKSGGETERRLVVRNKAKHCAHQFVRQIGLGHELRRASLVSLGRGGITRHHDTTNEGMIAADP